MHIFDSFKPNVEKRDEKGDVESLVKTLRHKDANIRTIASESLDKLGWKPSRNSEEIYYLIAKNEWSRIYFMGNSPSVIEEIIEALKDKDYGYYNIEALKNEDYEYYIVCKLCSLLGNWSDDRTRVEKQLKKIAEDLYYRGGVDLMIKIAKRLETIYGWKVSGSPLDMAWDGIGGWQV